jgi:hypothetical protein
LEHEDDEDHSRYYRPNTEQELTDALGEAGFENVERFPSLSGKAIAGDADLPVFVARR